MPRDFDMHIFEIGPCPIVRSNDMKPRSISSERKQEKRRMASYRLFHEVVFGKRTSSMLVAR